MLNILAHENLFLKTLISLRYCITINYSHILTWSFIRRQTSGTSSDSEWQRVVRRVNASGNEWQWMAASGNEWERMTKSDNEWQGMTTSGTTNDNEWPFRPIFLFFQIREESTTKHPKENSLNLEEDLWRRPIELRAETSTQEEILTVRSRNCRSCCSHQNKFS